jgi:hypothetical protein
MDDEDLKQLVQMDVEHNGENEIKWISYEWDKSF